MKKIISNYSKAMVVQNASLSAGANVFQWQYDENSCYNDIWVLEPIKAWTGSRANTWDNESKPAYKGELWIDTYNSDDNILKSTVNVFLNSNDITRIKNEKTSRAYYWGLDVTSHRKNNENVSDLSAYAVITNIPNPKIDIEDDELIFNNEESEVICLSPENLIAGQQYRMITYWKDKRNGNNEGYIELSSEFSVKGSSDYNFAGSQYRKTISYGKTRGQL